MKYSPDLVAIAYKGGLNVTLKIYCGTNIVAVEMKKFVHKKTVSAKLEAAQSNLLPKNNFYLQGTIHNVEVIGINITALTWKKS